MTKKSSGLGRNLADRLAQKIVITEPLSEVCPGFLTEKFFQYVKTGQNGRFLMLEFIKMTNYCLDIGKLEQRRKHL